MYVCKYKCVTLYVCLCMCLSVELGVLLWSHLGHVREVGVYVFVMCGM